MGILFIFLLIYIIINGNALTDINDKINNINNNTTENNIQNDINNLKEILKEDEKNVQINKDNIKTSIMDITELKNNYKKLSSSMVDNTDIIELNNFGLFTLTVVNDYSFLQKNKIKTSDINKEIQDFYNKAKYFNISNIVVINNIKIAKVDDNTKDTDYIYSLGEKDGYVYKTYVSFKSLNNLQLNINKLLTFTTKTGILFIKFYVFNIPGIEGNEFIFMIITHNTDLYPNNDILVQKELINNINTKIEDFLKTFKDPLITIISTLEQEYTEKFFSAFTFMKANDYKKIQGDLDIIASNTDIQLYNSLASNKFNNLYDSYKKGISIYKLKQPDCRSIFLN